jgi:hypothetical protein
VEKLGVQLAHAEPSSYSARHEANANAHQQQEQSSEHDAAGGESRGRENDGQRSFRHRRADPGVFSLSFADSGTGQAPFDDTALTGEESS